MIDLSLPLAARGFITHRFERPASGAKIEQLPIRYGASGRNGSRLKSVGSEAHQDWPYIPRARWTTETPGPGRC